MQEASLISTKAIKQFLRSQNSELKVSLDAFQALNMFCIQTIELIMRCSAERNAVGHAELKEAVKQFLPDNFGRRLDMSGDVVYQQLCENSNEDKSDDDLTLVSLKKLKQVLGIMKKDVSMDGLYYLGGGIDDILIWIVSIATQISKIKGLATLRSEDLFVVFTKSPYFAELFTKLEVKNWLESKVEKKKLERKSGSENSVNNIGISESVPVSAAPIETPNFSDSNRRLSSLENAEIIESPSIPVVAEGERKSIVSDNILTTLSTEGIEKFKTLKKGFVTKYLNQQPVSPIIPTESINTLASEESPFRDEKEEKTSFLGKLRKRTGNKSKNDISSSARLSKSTLNQSERTSCDDLTDGKKKKSFLNFARRKKSTDVDDGAAFSSANQNSLLSLFTRNLHHDKIRRSFGSISAIAERKGDEMDLKAGSRKPWSFLPNNKKIIIRSLQSELCPSNRNFSAHHQHILIQSKLPLSSTVTQSIQTDLVNQDVRSVMSLLMAGQMLPKQISVNDSQ